MNAWLAHHRTSCALALRRLVGAPVNTFLSLVAIGIALALPAGGQLLLDGLRQLSKGSSSGPQISVFLSLASERTASQSILARLEKHSGVAKVRFLPREETLARMKSGQGLREVIEVLASNPFPDAFVVNLRNESPDAMEGFATELRGWPGIEHVQIDSAWVRRLDALLRLGRSVVLLLSGLLGCGLVAISFSIIRMQVLTQRAEIEVSRLLGASESYIRRPFLYQGLLLGIGGSAIAWLLVSASALWLRVPVAELVGLYDLKLVLGPPDLRESIALLAFGGVMGWLGAQFSLRQNLGAF